MDNRQIKNIMLKMGGHCEDSLNDLENARTVRELTHVLFDYIKPCMEKDFPTYEIMEHFKLKGEPYGVYVDSRGVFEAQEQNILYGDSTITLHVKPYDVIRIYLKHIAHVDLSVGEKAIVLLYKFDQSTFKIINGDENNIFIRDKIK